MRARYKGYKFFRSQGMGARAALSLARAEAALREALDQGSLAVEWQDDPFADDSFVDGWDNKAKEAWRAEAHEPMACRLIRPCPHCLSAAWRAPETCRHAETLASLWSIYDPDRSYMRVIEAELAFEAGIGRA